MPKSSKHIFYQLLYYRCYPHSLSNGVIPISIMSSLTTHPAQHPHLNYTYLILMLTLNRPTLRSIQHRWSDCCLIEISFQLKWYFLIAQNTWGSSLFQPPSLNKIAYICFYFSVIYTMDPRYLNRVTWGMIWSPTFTSKEDLLLLLLKLNSIYSVLLLLKRKPYASKACLQVSSLPFNSSLDSPSKTTSSAKSIHLSANSWMCYISGMTWIMYFYY
jgi:hypothetical protein